MELFPNCNVVTAAVAEDASRDSINRAFVDTTPEVPHLVGGRLGLLVPARLSELIEDRRVNTLFKHHDYLVGGSDTDGITMKYLVDLSDDPTWVPTAKWLDDLHRTFYALGSCRSMLKGLFIDGANYKDVLGMHKEPNMNNSFHAKMVSLG